jgi:hypothetical protein
MKRILLIMLLFIGQAQAVDGVFAINDVCDNFGCFPGDTGGRPITITQSGSYKLTSNLTSTSTTIDVIQINADNVTLDLNGFSIIGPRTCTGDNTTLVCTNSGMTASAVVAAGRKNIVVKNGITQGFDTGVLLRDLAQRGNKVVNINSSQNEFGITVINGIISDSIANRNLDSGFNNGLFGALFIKNSFASGNKNRSAIAATCSNVYFSNNGANNCGRYTNESTCDGVACP